MPRTKFPNRSGRRSESPMKRLMVLVLWVAAAAPARADMDMDKEREALIALSSSVLKIEVVRDKGGFSLGSGVVVAPEKILTNCHVTREALRINVVRGSARWSADSQMSDVDHDLCLLRVPGLQASTVALGQ